MEPTAYFPHVSIPVDFALGILLERTPGPERTIDLPLLEALHRIAGEDLAACMDLPPFDNSPLDGFALSHTDSTGASRDKPVFLQVVETIYAGEVPRKTLGPGECARVMTGAALPKGATCVIPWEHTDNQSPRVGIFHTLKAHQNYRFHGEELRQGQPLLTKGQGITVPHLGLLAAQGFTRIPVFPRPQVGILSTGSELMSGPEPLIPGKIYDSNRYFLAARVSALGAEPVLTSPIADAPAFIAQTIEGLLQTCDCIISTGGVSVGDRDYMPQAGAYIGAEPLFRRVQMKPGGWVTALFKDSKIILCLSGTPLAAAMSFDLLAGPVIRRLAGAVPVLPRKIPGVLQDPFPKASPQPRFLYARREGKEVFLPPAVSRSLASLIGCNCILQIPAGRGALEPGDRLDLIPLPDAPVSPQFHLL
ncbi:MAG: molybdopterin molybdotransferase MoeA [Treponema sp.]|jgi:molybdopterin molybdotransferase|nr:molybdopterin molybdotransferase MoeA [Treponema sp.]